MINKANKTLTIPASSLKGKLKNFHLNASECGPVEYPSKHRVSSSELLKGISFSCRTLSGTFSCEHLRRHSNIKQGCEMLHYTALPSSACVAYRMNFNDNSDIFWGHRKLIQEEGIHWSQRRAEVLCKNFITQPSDPSFEICECIQSHPRGDAETYGAHSKSDTTVHQQSPPEEAEKDAAPSSSTCHELCQSLSEIMKRKWLSVYKCDAVT